MTFVFLPEKVESQYFANLEKGPKGAPGESQLSFETVRKNEKKILNENIRLKLAFPTFPDE